MDLQRPLVVLACSAGADAETVQRFHGTLFPVLRALEGAYRFEINYCPDDAGDARTRIEALAQLDPRINLQLSCGGDDWIRRLKLDSTATLIIMDVASHAPELVPQLLELAKGPATVITGVPQQAPPILGWRRWFASPQPVPPPLLLLKQPAFDALLANAGQPMGEILTALEVPRAELAFVPQSIVAPSANASRTHQTMINLAETWRHTPLAIISHFGATVFAVGLFLAAWFLIQGLAAPGTVWFSWCYLIVLLHVLGGSLLFALGKVGAQTTRILQLLSQRHDASAPAREPAPRNSAIVPLMQPPHAA